MTAPATATNAAGRGASPPRPNAGASAERRIGTRRLYFCVCARNECNPVKYIRPLIEKKSNQINLKAQQE
jgi:hypothetical protein